MSNPTQSQLNKRDKRFDNEWEERRWCWGCGSTSKPLSRAHIVRYSSIPYVGAKIALQMDIENMSYLCMDNLEEKGCHTMWDNNNWEDEDDFQEIHGLDCLPEFLKIMKVKDPQLYKKRIEQIKQWIKYYDNN